MNRSLVLILLINVLQVISAPPVPDSDIREAGQVLVSTLYNEFVKDAQAMNPLELYFKQFLEFVQEIQKNNHAMSVAIKEVILNNNYLADTKYILRLKQFIGLGFITSLGCEYGIEWIEVRKPFDKYDGEKETLEKIKSKLLETKKKVDLVMEIVSEGTKDSTIDSVEQMEEHVGITITDHLKDMVVKLKESKEMRDAIDSTKTAIQLIQSLIKQKSLFDGKTFKNLFSNFRGAISGRNRMTLPKHTNDITQR